MRKFFIITAILSGTLTIQAQKNNRYKDSIQSYQHSYVQEHEVVKSGDKQFFQFFPIKEKYRVNAELIPIDDSIGFSMKTSGTKLKKFYRFGKLEFKIGKENLSLTIYSSEQKSLVKDSTHLFLPFTDNTSGEKSYGGGRYIDLYFLDIHNNQIEIDFNKAYNPYCAYTTGYNCPIPPRENHLPISISAGEMDFKKPH